MRPHLDEDRRLPIKKQTGTGYMAKSEIKHHMPDMKELSEQANACAGTIAMYPMDLDRALAEPLSSD